MPIIMIVLVVMVMVTVAAEEFRLDLHDAVEVEGIAPEHLRQGNPAALGLVQLGVRIDAADARLHLAERVGFDQIGLVEQDDVGERDLVLRLRSVAQAVLEPPRIGDGDDRIEPGFASDHLVDEKCLSDGRGVGKSRRLHNDGVKASGAAQQTLD